MHKQSFTLRGISYELVGDFSDWAPSFRFETPEENLEIIHVTLTAKKRLVPPKLLLAFNAPQRDAQIKWFPSENLFDCHHYQPRWWRGGREPSAFNRNVPVYSFMNQEGVNSMSFALSETFRPVFSSSGPFDGDIIRTELTMFSVPEEPCAELHFSLRVDRRGKFYAEILREISDWFSSMPENGAAMSVPEIARLPFYSTWYQYQKNVTQKKLAAELPYLNPMGLHCVIIDDGWQCETVEGGGSNMRTCGRWEPFSGKFSDLGRLVDQFHEKGVRCLLWIGLPFVGLDQLELLERFQDKFLPGGGDCRVLDPRWPEVREYLTECCIRLVRDYRLDGLKLDFIDRISQECSDSTVSGDSDGCDTPSLMKGVERLLCGIRDALTALRPDVVIEFRQFYTGPRMKKYGNVFRASDCAHDLLQNRVRTIDLRLLSGNSAVHSDMVIWSKLDTPQVAALQILNVLFSVPQVSVELSAQTEANRKMIAFWMRFCSEHRKTLQEGMLRPEHPELSYPLVSASREGETITAVYLTGWLMRRNPGVHIMVNATHTAELLIETETACRVRCLDVFGEFAGETVMNAGINRISVPPSGMAIMAD